MNQEITALEEQLNHFDPSARAQALDALLALVADGTLTLPPADEVANMHCHTFFSFNGYGYSPTGLAWLAKRRGYKLMGIVDFDILDAVDEWLRVADMLALRASTGMETRAYLPEFAAREINSPGEPGITYHMGIGFASSQVPEGEAMAQRIIDTMRRRAVDRNLDLIARVNSFLDPVAVDYERDVLPLTPAGNPTERHICLAYVTVAAATVHDPVHFWAAKLDVPEAKVAAVIDHGPAIQNLVRSKLMKRGGVGYVQPGPDTFPPIDEVNKMIAACGALPTITWLDGTSEGEQAAEELFDLMIDKGAVALNIVPDRNWNIADRQAKGVKLQNLYDVVALAESLALPINVGTEMNAYGTPLIDNFDAPEMAPVRRIFLDGAYFVYAHTTLHRAVGLGYQSAWAVGHFPDRRERNAFYTQVGRALPPGTATLTRLRDLGTGPDPDDVLRVGQS
ncbi:MAG: hypothetical protein JXC32_01060 [Anaerolineae bacterium]|nr:hypothetical protein [Anaerolineae bacterium]